MSDYIRKTARYNGKKYEATGRTEREASMKLAEKLAAAKRGEEVVGGSMTVNTWYKQWFELYKEPKKLTAKSLAMYEEKYNNHIKPQIGNMKLRDVTAIHLQRIMNNQKGMSTSHTKKVKMVLQEMFRKARKTRIIAFDPAEDLEMPETTEGARRSITETERKAILEVAEWQVSGLWILTLLYSGIRPGESAALIWADVDFKNNELHIHSAKESGTTDIKAPKTDAGVRDIPMHAELRKRLMAVRGEPFALVFPNAAGRGMDDSTMYRRWKAFLRAMDIHLGAKVYRNKIVESKLADDLTLYCLRHTFCTDLQRAGVPINVAKELMGHSDISVTANIYTHKDSTTLHEGMARLDGTGGKSGGKKKKKTADA